MTVPAQTTPPLRAVVVGCRTMGRWHATALAALPEYELVACCDLVQDRARAVAEELGAPRTYADYAAMLSAERPEVVCIVTANDVHAAMTIQAAEAGARAVYCEKPMATCLADGQAMVAACREHGAVLSVNHQRRLSAPVQAMRRLITEGAIGEPYLFRGSCAGDLLTDATHLVDTIRFLAGDAPARWAFGQVHREVDAQEPYRESIVQLAWRGYRYGHPVENGALCTWEFEGGARAEVFCGDLQLPGRSYGDYEVFGTEGRLWRAGDAADPPVLLLRHAGGGWEPVQVEGSVPGGMDTPTALACYRQFARVVHEGAANPLSGDSGLLDLELIMALFESARLRARIALPLQQPRHPLALLIEAGEL